LSNVPWRLVVRFGAVDKVPWWRWRLDFGGRLLQEKYCRIERLEKGE
jgi:hypothetical protein